MCTSDLSKRGLVLDVIILTILFSYTETLSFIEGVVALPVQRCFCSKTVN